MGLQKYWRVTTKVIRDVDRKHLLAFSGSLAYYYFLALVPMLVLFASLLAYLPVPHLFDEILLWMSYFVPTESMNLVKRVLSDVMATRNSGFLSFGIVGTIWTASGASAAMIEALNVVYEAEEGRPFWRTRILAIALTFMLGLLVSVAVAAMILGPELGSGLAHHLGLDPRFTREWSSLRWVLAAAVSVFAVELVYYVAPNVEQRRFKLTLPGAVVAVATWLAASRGLGFYLRHFSRFSKSYGTLGAIAALLLWFYVSSAAILIGAQINSDLLKAEHERLPLKEAPNAMDGAEPPDQLAA